MILALGGNDMLRGLPPDVARQNLTRIMRVAQDQNVPVLLIGLPAPRNYGADYKAKFDAIYPDLAKEFNAIYLPNFFEGLGTAPQAELQRFFQPDGIHPNAEGVRLIVQEVGPRIVQLVKRTSH